MDSVEESKTEIKMSTSYLSYDKLCMSYNDEREYNEYFQDNFYNKQEYEDMDRMEKFEYEENLRMERELMYELNKK